MGNIISYLDLYSDVSFNEMSFNYVDNLILCALSYCRFQDIIPSCHIDKKICLKKVSECFYRNKTLKSLPPVQQLLYKMSCGKRFLNAFFSNYENLFNPKTGLQFCAFQIDLSDETTFIAIRGTDNSISGWKENFTISYEVTPSQRAALNYINKVIKSDRKYRIGGHSKGGNLAQYAASMCSPDIQSRIINIYSNDGPGILDNFVSHSKYEAISDKLVKIVPEFNFIGSLLDNEPPTIIVKSSKKGIVSHDALTWCVENDHFMTCDSITKRSRLYSILCNTFINSLSFSQRKRLINNCFLAISKTKLKDILKLTE